MATISITIPDGVTPRVVDALCSLYGYADTLPDGSPNPQAKGQFAKQCVIQFLRESVKAHEANVAARQAQEAAAAKAEAEITLS